MDRARSTARRRVLQRLASVMVATPFVSLAKGDRMRRIFITGSTDGLGRGAAQALIDQGHQVVLHARTKERAAALADLAPRAAGVAIGDLSSAAQTRSLAEQVNKIGRMDAVIHNAGIFRESGRGTTEDGHARVLAVNVLAPYLLTKLIERPERLIYLSSSMHRGGEGPLDDIDWNKRSWDTYRAYSESKLYVTTLAFAVARQWPKVFSNAVDPGWGTHEDGRTRRSRRPRGRPCHPGLACGQRRPRRQDQRGVVVSPKAAGSRGAVAGSEIPG
jgi:NAD(P)-dependent dehydrogenase (short-subunit alcohol dehydrogenase family)